MPPPVLFVRVLVASRPHQLLVFLRRGTFQLRISKIWCQWTPWRKLLLIQLAEGRKGEAVVPVSSWGEFGFLFH